MSGLIVDVGDAGLATYVDWLFAQGSLVCLIVALCTFLDIHIADL